MWPAASGFPSKIAQVAVQIGGEKYIVAIPIGETWRARQVFERGEYGRLPAGVLRTPPVVVDVGANVGTFAVYAKLAYHRGAAVHCFEPYPPAVGLLDVTYG